EEFQARRLAWRAKQWLAQKNNPVLQVPHTGGQPTPPGIQQLMSQGINLIGDSASYPPDFDLTTLPNYSDIVRAFSRAFGPNLFDEVGLPGPAAGCGLYWN